MMKASLCGNARQTVFDCLAKRFHIQSSCCYTSLDESPAGNGVVGDGMDPVGRHREIKKCVYTSLVNYGNNGEGDGWVSVGRYRGGKIVYTSLKSEFTHPWVTLYKRVGDKMVYVG